MKKTYKIPVTYLVYGFVEVEAESEKELMELLTDKDFVNQMPLADDPEYVEDTYEIEFDAIDLD